MIITIIAATGENQELGAGNRLLWRLRDDLRTFKRLTMGHHILMGRKTYSSIGRPLPGRTSIVLSRSTCDALPPGVLQASSVEEGIRIAANSGESELFIIGGGEIYRQTLPLADRMYLTKVQASFPEADTWFPETDLSAWHQVREETYAAEKNSLAWSWHHLERCKPAHASQ